MNRHKYQTHLVISILLALLGLLLFNSNQVTEPVLAQIAPTSTPRRVTPTVTPRRQAPRDLPFKAYLPLVLQPPLDSFTMLERDLAAGLIDINQATTYKFYALFQSPLLPPQYQSAVPILYDGQMAFVDTLSHWDQLNSTTQQTLSDFLNPQTITLAPSNKRPASQAVRIAGCDLVQLKTTAHFVIWYSGADPRCQISGQAYVDTIANGLEDAWAKYKNMNYSMPVSTTVYVLPFINIPNAGAVSLPPGIIFPGNLPAAIPADLQAKAAHEFFHRVQWNYFGAPSLSCPWIPNSVPHPSTWIVPISWVNNEDVRWWMESSAQWAQHEVYSNDQTYFQPIGSYLNSPWTHLDTRPVEGGTGFPYGSFLFPTYLTETLPAHVTLIRTTWERYWSTNNGCGTMMSALQGVLQTQGTTMEQVFPNFTEANYSLAYPNQADYRTAPGIGNNFRPNPESVPLNDQNLTATGPVKRDGRQNVEHLGSAYVEFQNNFPQPPIGRALTVTVDLYVDNPSVDLSLNSRELSLGIRQLSSLKPSFPISKWLEQMELSIITLPK